MMKTLTATILCILLSSAATYTQCHMDDWSALKALYTSTNGDNWTNNSGWSQVTGTTPPANCNLGNMHRVILDANNRVSKLLLYTNNLTGSIPAELGGLTHLKDLTLSSNSLTGSIPVELGDLADLTKLNLNSNDLSGTIPSELGNLDNLEILVLGLNQLTGPIPAELGDLANLINLNLRTNQLSGPIPPELGGLANLTIMSLGINQLSGSIPSELGGLANLTNLSLYTNMLNGNIPPELGDLNNLGLLWLYGNQLAGAIPPELGDLSNLTTLRLNSNQLTGDIPADLSDLSSLAELHLQTNLLTGNFPPVFGNLGSLTDLQIGSNQLVGCYDPNLLTLCTQLDDIRNIFVSNGNNFDADWEDFCASGAGECVPASQAELDYLALRALYLCTDGDNWTSQLDGNAEWPSAADFMSNPTTPTVGFENLDLWYGVGLNANGNVDDLNLADNNLIGCVPSELGDLTDLLYLELNNNQLIGSIPIELGNLNQLIRLYLDDNQLNGSIPIELANLTQLAELDLSVNQLVGNIPPELGSLSNLIYLILYNNQLTGTIPSELGNLINLELLGLMNNQLTGTIPIELGYLVNLIELSLTNNQLTGTIPSELENLHNVTYLNLGNNQLVGNIPAGLGNLTSLEIFILKNNGLSGCLDESFWDLCSDLENIEITEGNSIDWENYCETGAGSCSQLSACEIDQYIILRELYLSTAGDSWFSNTGWPSASEFLMHPTSAPPGSSPLSAWAGVFLDVNGCIVKLNLSSNNLSGPIPISIGNLSYLTELWLDDNKLTGKIPTSIGDLTNLELLLLDHNQLQGNIPASIGNLSLNFLELNDNNLNECYDANLSNLCTQLPIALNSWMSDGNNFTATWEDFCNDESGVCSNTQEIQDDRICDWSKAGLVSEFCHPQMFINIVDDHQADNTGVQAVDVAVSAAITSAGQNGAIIFFPQGTYLFKDPIVLEDGIVLKGAGASTTIFNADLDGDEDFIIAHGDGPVMSTSLKNDAPRFQDFIEVDNPSMFQVGSYIKLDFDDDHLLWNSWGSVGQIVRVVSKESNGKLNLHSPLRRTYTTSENTMAQKIDMIERVGVECLRINLNDEIKNNGYNISFEYAADSWVHAIESNKCNKAHIGFIQSAFCQVGASYFHDAHFFGTGGNAYGIEVGPGTADVKIENNMFKTLRHSILVQGGANGNVIAYNYSTSPNKKIHNTIGFDEGGIFNNVTADLVCHGNYPYLNLFESNICHYAIVDASHGDNGPFNTFFRNRTEFRRGMRISRREKTLVVNIAGWEETYPRTINDNQNIVGNEISLKGRGSNYKLKGDGHFEYGNHVDKRFGSRTEPDGTDDIADVSYYFSPSDPPLFLESYQLPSIGYPNGMNDSNNPVKDRNDQFGQTYDACIPDCPPNRVIDENDILPSGTYAAKQTIFFNGKLETAANVTFCAGDNVVVGDLFEIELAQAFRVVIKGCAVP